MQLKQTPLIGLSIGVVLVALLPVLSMGQRTRRPAPARPARVAIDYSRFSHATAKHQAACSTCHKIPTSNWQKVSTFPDITDFPAHSACVSCHRSQFFKGVRPVICSVCHSRTSPRDDDRLDFRRPAVLLQFTIEFPHDKHQDVIAFNRSRSVVSFSHAARNVMDQGYCRCVLCHSERTSLPAAPAKGWTDGFVPAAATFKASSVNHSSCFNCHWKEQQPVAQNCNGCHKLAKPYSNVEAPARISMKFIHDGGGEKKNHVAECTTCHINITKAASLRGLKPDVPITACTECHNKDGLRLDVSKELMAIDKDRSFTCTYCHTSDVGKLDPPASHYLIAGRPSLKRKDVK